MKGQNFTPFHVFMLLFSFPSAEQRSEKHPSNLRFSLRKEQTINGVDMMTTSDRLEQQIRFILEIDKLKTVLRRSYLLNGSRYENSAEHSWHLAVMALVLAEHANEPVDLCRVLKMLLVHDIVEIDAGDTYCYDEVANQDKAERERRAAERLFGLLPPDQRDELRALWEEFEARQTPEAKFAAALDRLMPLMHNFFTGGRSWQEHGVTLEQVLERNSPTAEGSATLWAFAKRLIDQAVEQGLLPSRSASQT